MSASTPSFTTRIGVYDEDAQGNPVYNWSYVDQIYDGLLAQGVRPFVEISFRPKSWLPRLDYHAFLVQADTSPPKDYAKWVLSSRFREASRRAHDR